MSEKAKVKDKERNNATLSKISNAIKGKYHLIFANINLCLTSTQIKDVTFELCYYLLN